MCVCLYCCAVRHADACSCCAPPAQPQHVLAGDGERLGPGAAELTGGHAGPEPEGHRWGTFLASGFRRGRTVMPSGVWVDSLCLDSHSVMFGGCVPTTVTICQSCMCDIASINLALVILASAARHMRRALSPFLRPCSPQVCNWNPRWRWQPCAASQPSHGWTSPAAGSQQQASAQSQQQHQASAC